MNEGRTDVLWVGELGTSDELLLEELEKNDELLCVVKEFTPGFTRLLSEGEIEGPVSDDTVTVTVELANTVNIDDRAIGTRC